MTYQQKQTTLQPMEGDISASPLPFQEHCTTALPFITVPDEDSAYALQVAPNCDSATLPQGIENLEGKRVIDIPVFESMTHYLMSKEELENKIATLTGGRAAEELVFHSITTGASNDIEQATKLARAMLTRYGMSDEFGMVALETVQNQYLGGDTSLACAAGTQEKIDQLVVDLVRRQHEKAVQLLTNDREKLDQLAQYLYEKETITGEEFMKILNG